ncbi:MAG: GAF domain-containing protein [Chloroflexi bacterium]|nr:MAG: GAF domain-containing protein [Chloroflexota bacterium]
MIPYDYQDEAHALRPQELDAVYSISRAIARTVSVDSALDEIVRLTRTVFIFDTMVIFLPGENGSVEPSYARNIGRGKNSEDELAWGEPAAAEAYRTGQTYFYKEEHEGWPKKRLALHYFLAMPLSWADQILGSLVFGRFGGPQYTPEQIYLAEFICAHIAQLLGRQHLVERIASLEAERRLDQLQQDFIATISHEFCTPLGFIKGYATTLLREDTTWDEATRQEFLTIIEEESDKLRELIDTLLDSSRLQSGTLHMQFQPIRLDTLLRDISVRASSGYSGLNVNLVLKKGEVRCFADPTRIAQVFDNLISNAVKYAPGSEVILTLDVENDKAHVTITDHGPGIPPEHMKNLFKRFYRVPDYAAVARGTGLGLFICRQIIQAHGGEITVDSTIGMGTTFHMYLNALDPETTGQNVKKEEMLP